MKRSPAILAIITTLGTTTTAASAPARGIGPEPASDLAAGALTSNSHFEGPLADFGIPDGFAGGAF